MKIKINNNTYSIDEGSVLNENYNETLDNAVIRISHLENEINIEPFDDVEIQDDNGIKFRDMCIDNYDCVQEAIGQNDTTYSYTINLFSLTKKLEGIILPNLSITQHKNVSELSQTRIIDFLTNIRNLYCPKYWNEDEQRYVYDWAFSTDFIDKFYIICPEMQWTTPTFRELFNDLTLVNDSIVILRKKSPGEDSNDPAISYANYVIDYIDITETNDASSKTYNFIRKTRSSDDHISEIRMELQNVLQTKVEGINNVVTTSEYLTFSSDSAIITSDNIYLKTQFPILNIKHLWLMIVNGNEDGETIQFKYDLCNINAKWANPVGEEASLVYEKLEYDTLPILYRTKISSPGSDSNKNIENFYSKYKNYCVYFTRNSNRIEGFTFLSNPILNNPIPTLNYIKLICNTNAKYDGYIEMYNNLVNAEENSYFSTFFQIEYETTYGAVFQVSKDDRPRNNKVIADNQTNAWVDAYSQGFLEYQKANRLGNLQKLYNQRKSIISDLYVIGDKIEDDIIYRTEYQFYKNHIEGNSYSTKNYVLRDYFTGIKSKIRTWVNARDEAFIRHDLKKYYCEFSYEQKTLNAQVESSNYNKSIANYLLSPLNNGENANSPIKYVLVKTTSTYEYYPSSSTKFALNCISRLIGNSITLTTGFNDNWIVEKHPNIGTRDATEDYDDTGIITSDDIKTLYYDSTSPGSKVLRIPTFDPSNNNYGGITTNYYKYCDENGEFDNIEINFLQNLNISNITFPINYVNKDDIKNYFISLYRLPVVHDVVTGNSYIISYNIGINKDNKEKPIITTQFEFCRDDRSISFTKEFLARQKIIKNIDDTNSLNVKLYNSNYEYMSTVSFDDNITITKINDFCAKISYSGPLSNVKFIEICNNSDKLISYDITKNGAQLFLNIRRYL